MCSKTALQRKLKDIKDDNKEIFFFQEEASAGS